MAEKSEPSIRDLPIEQLERMEARLEESEEELSKWSLLHDMSDMDKLRFFSRLSNEEERLRLNTVEMAIDLMRKRFNLSEDNIMLQMLKNHVTTHLLNGVSMHGLREKAYVDALKGDRITVSDNNSNEIKKWVSSK